MLPKSFYVPNLSPTGGGPHIFGKRLIEELVTQGLNFHPDGKNQLSLISGHPRTQFNNQAGWPSF